MQKPHRYTASKSSAALPSPQKSRSYLPAGISNIAVREFGWLRGFGIRVSGSGRGVLFAFLINFIFAIPVQYRIIDVCLPVELIGVDLGI